MKLPVFLSTVACLFSVSHFCSCTDPMTVTSLECEELVNPIAIDNRSPHLSWILNSETRDERQTAYQVLAASDESLLTEEKADLWNSGKVDSQESVQVPYQGKGLSSRSLVYWKVRVWDEDGDPSAWSNPARFGVGLLEPGDWTAKYIGAAENGMRSPVLRKTFRWDGHAENAFLHVNSLGYHEVWLNGQKVGDDVLSPAVSQYDKRSLSVTYDLNGLLKEGENDLALWLGKGWYRENLPGVVPGGPFVRAQIDVRKADRSWSTLLVTDSTWLASESAYTSFGSWRPHLFGGEILNASGLSDMRKAALDTATWKPALVADIPSHATSPQMTEPNRIVASFHPLSVRQDSLGVWIFDMGKNLTGWTSILFPKLKKGQKIRIGYCDFLDKKGEFRDGLYEDFYIASGNGKECFVNKFNYKAYRYLKLSGIDIPPALSDVTAHLIRTGYSGKSEFSCSDKDMNAIHDMIQYTLECLTLGGYMVDCPQIERLGYGGDGNASTLTAQTMFNLAPLYRNWMQAWRDSMKEDGSMPHTAPNPYTAGGGPFWCGFIVTASWQTYVNYADRSSLEESYPYMQQWMAYAQSYMIDGLLKRWPDTDYRGWYLGDWATPSGINQTDPSSVDLVNNCFLAVCFDTMSKIAASLGEEADSRRYASYAKELKALIHKTFYNPETRSYASGTQIDLVYPMLAGVVPEECKGEIMETLLTATRERFGGHLATGLVGVPVITQWATESGNAELMYSMLKQRDYPGYLYMIDNGATTTWEHWNGERSHIHNCYNGIGSWFYQALAGIVPDERFPGYRHVTIKPQPVSGISWVKAAKDTPHGRLAVEWERERDEFRLSVSIPVGCSATVYLPNDPSRPIKLASGRHDLSVKAPIPSRSTPPGWEK